ncbi:hypothetical protein POM88_038551 [Heracleum sosnowskyi]|uniref:Uncharacterized protein n=1 Tax=Heracleum sosnowskyi TaxID=360622 RepID=A0AAD8H8Q3_9APIA|nr:hypothetical protein POM88_038551 [Heracleum sosnowskyi]
MASKQSCVPAPGMHFIGGVSWNGCMHWLSELHTNLEPESSISDCLYFNVDEERLGTFPKPPIVARSTSVRILYFWESEAHLHVIEVCPYDPSPSVFETKSDYTE